MKIGHFCCTKYTPPFVLVNDSPKKRCSSQSDSESVLLLRGVHTRWAPTSCNICAMKKNSCLGYIGDNTTELYGDYNKPLYTIIRIPFKQAASRMERFVFSWLIWQRNAPK